jgi:hypothetical protein
MQRCASVAHFLCGQEKRSEATTLTRLCGSRIIKNWKFIERQTPRQLPNDGLVTERPDKFEGYGVGAFLAFRECLAPEQRDFMGQAMSGVNDLINSTGRNHRARFEFPPKHCGKFYQEYRLASVHPRTKPVIKLGACRCRKK